MSDDLEEFIQAQKNKLAQEREQLSQAERSPRTGNTAPQQNGVRGDSGRKKWDTPAAVSDNMDSLF